MAAPSRARARRSPSRYDGSTPAKPDHEVIYSVAKPFKKTGGLRLLEGNLAPDGGAIIKVAGVEGGVKDGRFIGRARVFDGEHELIAALEHTPGVFADKDMVVIRYEGPRGAPGMPEMLDPTSRITTLCRQKGITIGLMTDARFSGGSVGLVVGHVGPEAYLGGPIALIEDGDTIVVDINTGPPGLPGAGRRRGVRQTLQGLAGRRRTERRRPPQGQPRHQSFAQADARQCPPALQGGGMAVE